MVAAAVSACSADAPVDLPSPEDYAQQLHQGANAERVSAGLEPLEWSECILPVAQERSEKVNETGELTHEPLAATCNDGATTGENLSRAEDSPERIVEMWMASPGHEANILNPAFTTVAVACARETEDAGPMSCSWVAEGLSPDDPDYDPDAQGEGTITVD